MYRAIGDKFFAMAKNHSHGVLEGGIARDLGESGSQFWRWKRVLGFSSGESLRFRVFWLEKRPSWTVGRFCDSFLWP